ncbi:hypothetical protein Hdeb2414_s0012g00394551 [Helianthus debilis subsp. tardiflorus]
MAPEKTDKCLIYVLYALSRSTILFLSQPSFRGSGDGGGSGGGGGRGGEAGATVLVADHRNAVACHSLERLTTVGHLRIMDETSCHTQTAVLFLFLFEIICNSNVLV